VYSRWLLRLAAGEPADEGWFVSQWVVPDVLSRYGFQFQHPQLMPALLARPEAVVTPAGRA
jgi:NAD dependent epimerase/dehydratase family enzyme